MDLAVVLQVDPVLTCFPAPGFVSFVLNNEQSYHPWSFADPLAGEPEDFPSLIYFLDHNMERFLQDSKERLNMPKFLNELNT